MTSFLTSLSKYDDLILITNAITVLLGDFNFPDILWNSFTAAGCGLRGSCQEDFINFVLGNNFHPSVFEPTRFNNILDQVLCNDPFAVTNCKVGVPFSTSDHNSVSFNVLLPESVDLHNERINTDDTFSRFNFNQAN